ncbi:MAG TPA: chaperone modulator CbpM [Casimicrobiaceae bacterium]|nr:chaperone modulator CbpM [Casimicrobiaceae bacterium]
MVKIESTSAVILDDSGALTIAELIEQSGLTETELSMLVDCGALEVRDVAGAWRFSARCVVTARTARRLRDDFALDDAHALTVLLRLMQRIETLERALRARR